MSLLPAIPSPLLPLDVGPLGHNPRLSQGDLLLGGQRATADTAEVLSHALPLSDLVGLAEDRLSTAWRRGSVDRWLPGREGTWGNAALLVTLAGPRTAFVGRCRSGRARGMGKRRSVSPSSATRCRIRARSLVGSWSRPVRATPGEGLLISSVYSRSEACHESGSGQEVYPVRDGRIWIRGFYRNIHFGS